MSFGGKRVIFEKQSLILHSLEGKKKSCNSFEREISVEWSCLALNLLIWDCICFQVPCLRKTGNHLFLLTTSFR